MNTETKLRQTIQELTKHDLSDIDTSADLVEAIALDSIDGLRVIAGIERKLDSTFPDKTLGKLRSLQAMLEVIEEQQQ